MHGLGLLLLLPRNLSEAAAAEMENRGKLLPALSLCPLPARTKSKEPESRELCLDDLTFLKAQAPPLSLKAGA